MTDNRTIKRIPKSERPAPEPNDDLKRLAVSMRTVLIRAYPDPFVRQMVAVKIMRQIQTA